MEKETVDQWSKNMVECPCKQFDYRSKLQTGDALPRNRKHMAETERGEADRNRRKEMTYADFFYEIKGKFMGADVSDIHEHLAFQFNIEDEEAGGAFYVEVKDGVLYVEPYEYYDRDAMFICAPDVLLKISEGEMDPVAAFTAQKLRVEGNIEKALRLKEIIELKQAALQKEKSAARKAADKVVDTVVKAAAKKASARDKK